MKLEEIKMYEFTCTSRKENKDGIRNIVVTLVARDIDEAMRNMMKAHEFFDQDMHRSHKVLYKGFRQVEE